MRVRSSLGGSPACSGGAVIIYALSACSGEGDGGGGKTEAGSATETDVASPADAPADLASDAASGTDTRADDAGADSAGEAPDGLDGPETDSDAVEPPAPVFPSRRYADSLWLSERFLNIAHRGGGRLAPEETLVAWENAVAIGADVIECDVHSTRDDVLVCMHDDTVERTTDGTGRIRDLTFEELRALDAGFDFSPDGGATFPHRGAGLFVPTLDEFLDTFPELHFSIEIKQSAPSIAAPVVAAVQEAGADERVVIASFFDTTLAEVRALDPDLITALGVGEMLRFSELNDTREMTYSPPGWAIQAPYEAIDDVLLARAHRLGMRVHAWTVNDRADMERLLEMGVDGVFTDDPALLADVVRAR